MTGLGAMPMTAADMHAVRWLAEDIKEVEPTDNEPNADEERRLWNEGFV